MIKKKIVVTGGLGFIASNLIEILLKQNYKVINIDKISYSSNFYNTKEINNNKDYKFFKCDILNKEKIYKLLIKEKPIALFNLAAESHVDRSIDDPYPFIKNNILGIFNLLESVKKYNNIHRKFKLIHISTDEVYGDIEKGRTSENHKYEPSSPYAASKASSDHLVYSYYKTYNLPVIITNCSNNFGPRQHPEKLIPKLIYNIINNLDLPIYGNGKNSREWLHVVDHCSALYQVAIKGKLGEFYNIGSGINFSNLKIVNSLLEIAKKYIHISKNTKIKFIKDRPGHDIRYALNSNKIKNEIKWITKIKIQNGLEETFKWYLDNKEYFKTIKKNYITKRLGNG